MRVATNRIYDDNGRSEENSPDYIVLNSVSNVGKVISVLKEYKITFCLLDNDTAGKQTFREMTEAGCPVKDKSGCYRKYNDLNDYLLGRKMSQEKKVDSLSVSHANQSIQKSR